MPAHPPPPTAMLLLPVLPESLTVLAVLLLASSAASPHSMPLIMIRLLHCCIDCGNTTPHHTVAIHHATHQHKAQDQDSEDKRATLHLELYWRYDMTKGLCTNNKHIYTHTTP
eukprot:scpid67515/ scgid33312/ 